MSPSQQLDATSLPCREPPPTPLTGIALPLPSLSGPEAGHKAGGGSSKASKAKDAGGGAGSPGAGFLYGGNLPDPAPEDAQLSDEVRALIEEVGETRRARRGRLGIEEGYSPFPPPI